ncbi:MAG: ATP-binding protein, partial [Trichodesmium sp. St17_bin3_1_1]|nr:ATP-binding protein [Trichodesmium sp. St17_bin3_1_1]
MKKDNDSVPRLDLAPQLKRPLSIWNPLDYLRLLYWVFFFPQALLWYVEKYGGGEGLAEEKTWQSKLEFLRQHPNQLRLLFQGLILIVCVPFLFCILLQQIGFTIGWDGVAYGVALGVTLGVASAVWFGVAGGVAYGVA